MSRHTPLAYSPCDVPLRRARGAFDVNSIVVHEGILADVWEADRRWRELGGPDFLVIREGDTGSYNCRNSVGHSRAVAIDFNWRSNPYVKPRPSGGCPQQNGMERFYLECWRPLGYGWGGYWNSACDAMHISKLRREGGNGVLWQTWDDDEEDDVSAEDVWSYPVQDIVASHREGKPVEVPAKRSLELAHLDANTALQTTRDLAKMLGAVSRQLKEHASEPVTVDGIDVEEFADAVVKKVGAALTRDESE